MSQRQQQLYRHEMAYHQMIQHIEQRNKKQRHTSKPQRQYQSYLYNQNNNTSLQQYHHQIQSRAYSRPITKRKHTTKQKEKPLLNHSCSLPEDDEVLRASVSLLDGAPQVGDGYSSDNALFYGKISISKHTTNDKSTYLKKLGKEILTNNPKFSNIDPKDQLAIKSSEITTHTSQSKTLYNTLTNRSNIDTHSDDSFEKVQQTEIHRKEVIRTRQKMRRHQADDKSFLFFKYGSVGAVLCNLSASTLGCSVLCIPYVFSLCGCLYGCIIIIMTLLLQLISMRLLLQCQKCTGVNSIQMLTVLYLKNKCGVLFIHIVIFGYCFTQCIAILIALSDLIDPVLSEYVPNNSFVANRSFVLIMFTLIILVPISFLDKPSHLRHTKSHKRHSSLRIHRCRDCVYNICLIYLLCTISIAAMTRFYDGYTISFDAINIDPSTTTLSKLYSLTLGFPIVLYCLTTHTELFKVNDKLSSSNQSKLYQIAHGTLIQHTLYIMMLGICGYLYFCGDPKVETNIILNLKHKSSHIYIYIAMTIIGVAMFLFYWTVLQPSIHSISVLMLSNKKSNIAQHVLLTLVVDIFALIIALFIKDLSVLFAWSGTIFCSILSLIVPALLFWNIIVFPSKTFINAMTQYEYINAPKLNSIIATATPPLMNYARTVNDDAPSEDKSSLLSSHLSYKVVDHRTHNGALPNIMTPDGFNQMLNDSYSRLYGTVNNTKQSVSIVSEEKYDGIKYDSDISHSLSSTVCTEATTGHRFNSNYVSLSSHTKRNRQHFDSDSYGGERVESTRYRDKQKQRELSVSKTRNLKEVSKSIVERIETQLKEEKIQRIKTLEKVNQSWTFWFDRVGALLVFISGVILFIVGNTCNILHIVYT